MSPHSTPPVDPGSWPTPSIPQNVRKSIRSISKDLSRTFETAFRSDNAGHEQMGFETAGDWYTSEKETILSAHSADIHWWVEESERLVVCFGRTFDGHQCFEDRTGIVAKFQPSIPSRETPSAAANNEALVTYDQAVNRNDTDLFADIFDAGEDGAWLAQEYCIPIHPPRGERGPNDWMRDRPEKELVEQFKQRFSNRGWSGSFKRGNLGVTDSGDTVLLDIGGHTTCRME